MFGALTFGASTFGAKPFSGALVIEATGGLIAEAGLTATGAARASSDGVPTGAADVQSHLVAMRSASATATQAGAVEGQASIVSNASGLFVQSMPVLATGSGVVSAEGAFEAGASLSGYRLRAYDQLFPPNVANGDRVQVGARLYEWRANAGRWRPAGPAP